MKALIILALVLISIDAQAITTHLKDDYAISCMTAQVPTKDTDYEHAKNFAALIGENGKEQYETVVSTTMTHVSTKANGETTNTYCVLSKKETR